MVFSFLPLPTVQPLPSLCPWFAEHVGNVEARPRLLLPVLSLQADTFTQAPSLRGQPPWTCRGIGPSLPPLTIRDLRRGLPGVPPPTAALFTSAQEAFPSRGATRGRGFCVWGAWRRGGPSPLPRGGTLWAGDRGMVKSDIKYPPGRC